jgi:hypothetical protein
MAGARNGCSGAIWSALAVAAPTSAGDAATRSVAVVTDLIRQDEDRAPMIVDEVVRRRCRGPIED